jgi:hypothetical protein
MVESAVALLVQLVVVLQDLWWEEEQEVDNRMWILSNLVKVCLYSFFSSPLNHQKE